MWHPGLTSLRTTLTVPPNNSRGENSQPFIHQQVSVARCQRLSFKDPGNYHVCRSSDCSERMKPTTAQYHSHWGQSVGELDEKKKLLGHFLMRYNELTSHQHPSAGWAPAPLWPFPVQSQLSGSSDRAVPPLTGTAVPLHRIQIDYLASNEDSYTHTHTQIGPPTLRPLAALQTQRRTCVDMRAPNWHRLKKLRRLFLTSYSEKLFFPSELQLFRRSLLFTSGRYRKALTPVAARCTSAPPPCGRLALTQTPLLSQSARAQVLQEARSSYSSGSGGSHSSNRDGVKEDVFSLTVCVYYSMCRVGMRSTVRCDLNT